MKNKCSFKGVICILWSLKKYQSMEVGYMHFPAMPAAVISQCTMSKKDLPLKKRSTFLS